MLNYKKPRFWISLAGILAIAAIVLCLAVSPADTQPEETVAESVETVTSVTVTNADELLAAIAPNTEIILEAGNYLLSEAESYGKFVSDYVSWEERYDGYEMTITNVENLAIRGSGIHVTVLETDPRYANVLRLKHCENVTMEDFTAGHTRERGECSGGVVELLACENVVMNRLGLYGCGIVGFNAQACSEVLISDCDIYECSSSAAGIYSCHAVTVSGCRIYDIGDKQYGGYTFFDIQDSSQIEIESNSLSDSIVNNLLTVAQSEVLLKNNLFANTRPQNCAFSGSSVSITLDGNKFEGNKIRNWYDRAYVAKDPAGNTLTEADLEALYGTEPEAEPQPQMEVHVSTVDELIAAIGPNTEIVLDAAEYDLSTATGYGTSSGAYYYWEDIFDGPGLVIRDVDNMTIRSNDGRHTEHTISAVPRYADVLQFRACSGITVSGFTAGHTREPGSCAGGVLEFADCDGITVDNCGLFGCGILGVQADNCSNVIVQNSSIYECSIGGVNMHNVDSVVIEGTSFRDIGGDNVIYMSQCKNIVIDGEQVIGAESGNYRKTTPEQEKTSALNSVINSFSIAYLNGEEDFMQMYLASGYAPEPWSSSNEILRMWFETSYSQVQALQKKGSMVFEVPFRDVGAVDQDLRYLLVTVIEEDGFFKVSNCQVKE